MGTCFLGLEILNIKEGNVIVNIGLPLFMFHFIRCRTEVLNTSFSICSKCKYLHRGPMVDSHIHRR